MIILISRYYDEDGKEKQDTQNKYFLMYNEAKVNRTKEVRLNWILNFSKLAEGPGISPMLMYCRIFFICVNVLLDIVYIYSRTAGYCFYMLMYCRLLFIYVYLLQAIVYICLFTGYCLYLLMYRRILLIFLNVLLDIVYICICTAGYLYNKTRHSYIYIYVAYIRPNGWTDWAEIFWGHSVVAGSSLRLKKYIFFHG